MQWIQPNKKILYKHIRYIFTKNKRFILVLNAKQSRVALKMFLLFFIYVTFYLAKIAQWINVFCITQILFSLFLVHGFATYLHCI